MPLVKPPAKTGVDAAQRQIADDEDQAAGQERRHADEGERLLVMGVVQRRKDRRVMIGVAVDEIFDQRPQAAPNSRLDAQFGRSPPGRRRHRPPRQQQHRDRDHDEIAEIEKFADPHGSAPSHAVRTGCSATIMGGIAIFASAAAAAGSKPAQAFTRAGSPRDRPGSLRARRSVEIGDDVVEMLGHRRGGPLAVARRQGVEKARRVRRGRMRRPGRGRRGRSPATSAK